MRFDFTKGKEARYMVGVFMEINEDLYYFHTYREAKAKFDELKEDENLEDGAHLSIYDMIKDIRKDYCCL